MKLAEAINQHLKERGIPGPNAKLSEGLVEEVILPRLRTAIEAQQAGEAPPSTTGRRRLPDPSFPRAFALFFKNVDL